MNNKRVEIDLGVCLEQDGGRGEPLQDLVMWMIILNTLFMMCESHVNLCQTTHSDIYTAFRFDSDVFFDRAEEKKNSPVNRAGTDS